MIGFLSGIAQHSGENIIVMVGGVGYDVAVTPQLQTQLVPGTPVELHIYTHVKEDQLTLFGFQTATEKKLFLLLIGISGVGPRSALNLLSKGTVPLVQAVQTADVSFFKGFKRVGTKVAQKIIIELKSKLGSVQDLDLAPSQESQELREALLQLGFSDAEINPIIRELPLTEMSLEVALKTSLQQLKK